MLRTYLRNTMASFWNTLSIMLFLSTPVSAAEPIDGFRDLKFGMSPLEIQALPTCSTAHECLYELSNKNRYLHLVYTSNDMESGSQPSTDSGLAQITIDMGRFTDEWYQQLQLILANSYDLTHDFTDERLQAFLNKEVQELQAGYENGQVLLQLIRRPFGNIILKVVYQNSTLAKAFIHEASVLSSAP